MKSGNKKTKKEYIALSPKDKRYKIIDPLEENIKINNKKEELKVVEDDNGFTYIVYEGKKYLAEIIEKNQNKYTVLINGISYSFSIESPFSYERKKYLESQEPEKKVEVVEAPMPGKIVEVMVEAGQEVNEGDALIILEAMKMQNEINSPIAGKIKQIIVKANDTVNKEDVLVEIDI